MNIESLLKQFDIIEASIRRSKLSFECGLIQKENIEVVLYELIKSREQMLNMIQEIAPDRFAPRTQSTYFIPEPKLEQLRLCTFCGDPNCQSDHK